MLPEFVEEPVWLLVLLWPLRSPLEEVELDGELIDPVEEPVVPVLDCEPTPVERSLVDDEVVPEF